MERIGRYELVRVIGRGGFGTVYEAVQVGLRRRVALKVLDRGGDGLLREARLGGWLRHRHLVDVYQVGEHDGRWYCAMELCPLGTLAERGPLPPRAVVEVGLVVCAALHYAHEELGLVHLDLKPANLFVSAAGEVKVGDLGIARARGHEGDGRIRGTPGYMPPEQRLGRPVDVRADVHALGVTLVELATGRPHGAARTVDLDACDADAETIAPEWLRAVTERCLEADPADRFPSMAALAEALRTLAPEGDGLREALGLRPADPGTDLDMFVGRAAELGSVAAALAVPGVVVLKGPVGIGKSRLAREALSRWSAGTRPVLACALESARGAGELLTALASALDVPLGGASERAHVEQLGHALASRGPAAVLLDGFEQLTGFADRLVDLASLAPEARWVVTSRHALGTGTTLELPPMAPEDAVVLLAVRARERGADIASDPLLPELAARLDGLPLALELAAGRVGVLEVQDLLARLDLSLLRRGTDDRHGSIRAAFDSSWELLADRERGALARLSVFVGAFDAAAAEEVIGPDGRGAEVLGGLVECSMVARVGPDHFRLLAGVREWAAGKLDDPEAAVRHGRWHARFGAEAALDALDDRQDGAAARRALDAAFEDVVAACRRAVERGDGPVAVATLRAAWASLTARGPFERGVELARRVATLPSPAPPEQAAIAFVLGVALHLAGSGAEADTWLVRAVEQYRAIGDRAGEGLALSRLATLDQAQGRLEVSRQRGEEAVRLLTSAGAHRRAAVALNNLAATYRVLGLRDEARRRWEAALAEARRLGDARCEGMALANLAGRWADEPGKRGPALAAYEAALRVHRDLGDHRVEGTTLSNQALLYRDLGRLEDALRAAESGLALVRRVGDRRAEGAGLIGRATVRLAAGDLAGSAADLAEAERHLRDVGDPVLLAWVLAQRAEVAWEGGDRDGARRWLAQALEVAPDRSTADERLAHTRALVTDD